MGLFLPLSIIPSVCVNESETSAQITSRFNMSLGLKSGSAPVSEHMTRNKPQDCEEGRSLELLGEFSPSFGALCFLKLQKCVEFFENNFRIYFGKAVRSNLNHPKTTDDIQNVVSLLPNLTNNFKHKYICVDLLKTILFCGAKNI